MYYVWWCEKSLNRNYIRCSLGVSFTALMPSTGVTRNVFGVAGRQTRTGAGRHPEDQQGETSATSLGHRADHGGHRLSVRGRRTDGRVQVDVRTVRGHRSKRRRRRSTGGRLSAAAAERRQTGRRRRGRCQSDGHRASGPAQAVHVGRGGVQPGVLRCTGHARRTAAGRQQPDGSTVLAHDARQWVQPAPAARGTVQAVVFGRRRPRHRSAVMIALSSIRCVRWHSLQHTHE